MKRLFPIVLVLVLAFSGRAQVPVTNEVWWLEDDSSWGTVPWGTLPHYMAGGLAAVYPQHTNGVFDVGHSGANVLGMFQQHHEQEALAIMCAAKSNGVPFIYWETVNDNGALSFSDYVNDTTNLFRGPPLFYDNTSGTAVSNSGITLPGLFIAGSTIMNSSAADGDGGAVTRMNASSNINIFEGAPVNPNVWNDTKTNLAGGVSITDITGTKLFYTQGHPTPAHSYAIFSSRWSQSGFETNIGSICFNFGAGTVAASNHFAAVSLVKSGNTLSCTLKADRMPPPFDRISPTTPTGVISNNVAMPDMALYFPKFTNTFQWIIQATNLAAGNYTATLDGVTWFTATDVGLANGVNAAYLLTDNPFNLQRDKLLADYRDKEGLFHDLSGQTHNAGSAGLNGWYDLIIYMSQAQNDYVTLGQRGATLANTLNTYVLQMRKFDGVMYSDSQQTNHTLTITGPPAPRFGGYR